MASRAQRGRLRAFAIADSWDEKRQRYVGLRGNCRNYVGRGLVSVAGQARDRFAPNGGGQTIRRAFL